MTTVWHRPRGFRTVRHSWQAASRVNSIIATWTAIYATPGRVFASIVCKHCQTDSCWQLINSKEFEAIILKKYPMQTCKFLPIVNKLKKVKIKFELDWMNLKEFKKTFQYYHLRWTKQPLKYWSVLKSNVSTCGTSKTDALFIATKAPCRRSLSATPHSEALTKTLLLAAARTRAFTFGTRGTRTLFAYWRDTRGRWHASRGIRCI